MQTRYTTLAAAIVAISSAFPALAHDEEAAAEEAQGPWSGSVSLGYLSSSGNTDSTSGTFLFDVGYSVSRWDHGLSGRAFGSSQDNETNAENYKLAWKSDYNFNERNYAFGTVDYIKNRFSGYPRQVFAIVGYGRRVLDSEKFVLNLEVGAGYADQKVYLDPDLRTTEDEDGAVGRLGGDFTWNFSESGKFEQTLFASVTSANTYWESVSKISANLVGSLALGLSYTIQANTDVAPGVEKKDSFTAITLDYSF